MKKYAGILAAITSAVLFGFAPILGKLSYQGGNNSIMLVFLRAALALPVLFVLLRVQRVPLAATKTELRDVALVGTFGISATSLLLYTSYLYIPVGVATTLHYLYPVGVVLAGFFLFGQKISPAKGIALVLALGGVLLFLEKGEASGGLGIFLAAASSLTYTIYMLGVEKTSLRHMHPFKLTFYICLVTAVVGLVFALATGSFTLELTPAAWLYSFLVALIVSVGAITLLQFSITRISASATALLSTLEPLTSMVLGGLVLHEALSAKKWLGCVLILACVVLVSLVQGKRQEPPREG